MLSVSPDPAANLPPRAKPSRMSGTDGTGSDSAFASLIEPALDREPTERSQARSAPADDRNPQGDREPARDSTPAGPAANGTAPDRQPHASSARKPASRDARPNETPNEKISEKASETTATADDKGKTADAAATPAGAVPPSAAVPAAPAPSGPVATSSAAAGTGPLAIASAAIAASTRDAASPPSPPAPAVEVASDAVAAGSTSIAGAVADWGALQATAPPDAASTLPWVVRYMTPNWVAVLGLGAIAAAVMSSADSSILSASSMAGWNVYRPLFKPKVEPARLAQLIKRIIWIVGIAATLLALKIKSVYELWFLCSDFVYCLLFPPLVCALFDPKANTYGALAGFLAAFVFRFGGGDATLGLPILLPYPMIEDGVVLFPFRTLAMGSGLISIIVVSRLTGRWMPARTLQKME